MNQTARLAPVESHGRCAKIRAGNAHDFFAFVDDFRPGSAEAVERALPAAVRQRIFDVSRIAWIDAADDVQLIEAVVAHLGPTEAKHAWRTFTSQKLQKSPLVRTLVEGAVRVFGLDVGTMLRVFPRGYAQSYRDVATLEVERAEGRATVSLREVAPVVIESDAYLLQFEGVFTGLYDIALTKPDLRVERDVPKRWIQAEFRW